MTFHQNANGKRHDEKGGNYQYINEAQQGLFRKPCLKGIEIVFTAQEILDHIFGILSAEK
jgi:hypothetical protein